MSVDAPEDKLDQKTDEPLDYEPGKDILSNTKQAQKEAIMHDRF